MSVLAGDKTVLTVLVYGVQGIQDQKLGDGVDFRWSVDGSRSRRINITPGRGYEALYTAHDLTGSYNIRTELIAEDCQPIGGQRREEACSAEFKVKVRRPSAPPPTPEPCVNPAGEIPEVLTDSDGRQYEVFTPAEGGTFVGKDYSLKAGACAVSSGEIIGIRMSGEGPVDSDTGMMSRRYTLAGSVYQVSAVDADGSSLASYRLRDPVAVCAPLPEEYRSDLSELALATLNADGSLTILSTSVRLSGSGVQVCGNLSLIPALLAVGVPGAPMSTLVPAPAPELETPDTGGTAPTSALLIWAIIFAAGVLALGTALLAVRAAPVSATREPSDDGSV